MIKRQKMILRDGDVIDVSEYHDGRYGARGEKRGKRKKPTKEEMQKVNAQNKTKDYTYDLEGNLTSIKDPAGRSPCRVWSRRESTSGLYLWRKWNWRTGKR